MCQVKRYLTNSDRSVYSFDYFTAALKTFLKEKKIKKQLFYHPCAFYKGGHCCLVMMETKCVLHDSNYNFTFMKYSRHIHESNSKGVQRTALAYFE